MIVSSQTRNAENINNLLYEVVVSSARTSVSSVYRMKFDELEGLRETLLFRHPLRRCHHWLQ